MGGEAIRHWALHVAKTTWLVNTWVTAKQAGPSQSKPPPSVERDKVPMRNILGKIIWVIPSSGKPICGFVFAQGPGCSWWVIQRDREMCTSKGFDFWVRTDCNVVLYWLLNGSATVCYNCHGQDVQTAPDIPVINSWCSLQPTVPALEEL